MAIVIIHQYAADVNYCLPDIATQVYIYIIHIGNKFVKYLTKIFEKTGNNKNRHKVYSLCLFLFEL